MRIVEYSGKKIYIQANVLTAFFHRQQFDRDFYSDLFAMISDANVSVISKVVWSLSKSHDFDLLDYDQWIKIFDEGHTDFEGILIETNKFLRKIETDNDPKEATQHQESKLIASAMKLGFSLDALKIMLPSDLINSISTNENRKATSEEFQKFFG